MELADGGSGEWMDSVQVQRQEGTDVVAQKQAESKYPSMEIVAYRAYTGAP